MIEVQIKGVAIVLSPANSKEWPNHDGKQEQTSRLQNTIERLKDCGLIFADGTSRNGDVSDPSR